ncbi:unnamed protein product [Cladocopium goreaui]|uniref:Probable CTD kinase subunit alpha homolog (CTDK-I subunit alpha) (CTD kinase subunit 1) n=1 Tax=Cladocopium goreaui TaxID=2562237 RepID=A0A9P1G6X2_9DINO|nr:unnamed protein product [Cladocopium goreaui]
MPAFQKAEFCKESTEAFKKQRESCLKAGVRIRPVQRQGLEDSNRVDSGKIGIALQNTPGTNMLGTSFKIVGPAKGQGSFGAVYVVEHVHSRRRYAAKVEPVLASLDREIQILKGISHEAILPVLCSHVEDGGLSWYIMPLLPTNLFAYLRSENQFAHGSQDALFNQLMDGLGFLHDRGVVHADIKPGNIVYNPGTEHFYIIDFGIAVVLPTPRGQTTESVYTLAFRPPELIEQGELAPVLTVKADSWAAALTMLEASTRTRFFDGRSKVAIAEKIRSFARELSFGLAGGPHLTKLQGAINNLSPSTQKHVAELIHYDPRRRASCGNVAEELRN